MICALMIGRAGSTGFPGKNVHKVLGRPLCAYPLMAASGSSEVDRIFVSTDSDEIKQIAAHFNAEYIHRPAELATSTTLSDEVFVHAYGEMKRRLANEGERIELLVLLFANAATLHSGYIDQGVSMLRADPSLDGAATTSVYNMYSPLRARKLDNKGRLQPFVPFEAIGDISTFNTSRDSQGDVYYTDGSATVIRPKCLEHLEDGLLPHRWMGRHIGSIPSWGGCDVDYEWQVPMVEFWLRKHGFEEGQI
jgi:CMP-N-acetylneuraminic acid synthetase